MRWFWKAFAAAVLFVSLLVHLSTFIGNPMELVPGLMLIHVLIFPPVIAAILDAGRLGGSDADHQKRVMKRAPKWMRVMTGCFFAYALINFVIFIILIEGASADERDGRYVLSDHGRVIREITKAEFHRHQAYQARGFSGHWMAFSSAALLLLVGADRMRREARDMECVPGGDSKDDLASTRRSCAEEGGEADQPRSP